MNTEAAKGYTILLLAITTLALALASIATSYRISRLGERVRVLEQRQ